MIKNEAFQIEQEILSGFLNNQNLLREYKEKIHPKHFIIKIHQNFYNFLLEMDKKDLVIDPISFMNFNKNRLKEVDGAAYVSEISTCLPSQMGFATKIDLFIDNYKESLIRGIRHDLEVLETTEDLTKLLENTLSEVYNTTSEKEINIANDYDEYLSWLYGENEDIGIKSGLTNLDNILGKFQAGRMIGIFARSGVGKSTVAIQIALNMALQKHRIIYGSGEMSKAEVLNKMAASRLSIPYELLASKEITLEDKDRVCELISNLMNNGLYITNETDLNKLLAEVKSYKLKYGLDVLFVDYVNKYIKANNRNLSEKIGEVTSTLKDFALKEKVCVVLLAQANRESDKKTGEIVEKVNEGDIQDSARIEQDCDQVIALYRNKKLDNAEYRAANEHEIDYNSKSADKNPDCINFTVVKNRHGKKNTLAFRWNGKLSQVTNFMR